MEKLNAILQSYVADGDNTQHRVLGASLVVVNSNGILYEGAAGRIGAAVDSPPFTSDSSGWIASMTKIIGAAALMQIVERGLIKLDDDVRSLVPELASAPILQGFDAGDKAILETNADKITLRQLLCHTSGMSYDIMDTDIQKWSKAVGRTVNALDQTREGWNTPLRFRPGASWLYGSGIEWAGQILERVTGQSLGEYMSENIFKPLAMSDTTFRRDDITDRLASRIIDGCYRAPDGTLVAGPLPVLESPPEESGGAGLFSTAIDYAVFLQALLAAGEGQATLLRKESVDEMFRPQLNETQNQMMHTFVKDIVPFPADTPMNHGISGVINLADVDGKRRKGSLSWAGISNPQWWIDRDTGIAGVVFVQLLPAGDQVVKKLYNELERAVYSELLGKLR